MAFVPPTFNLSVNHWYFSNWNPAWNKGAGGVPGPDQIFNAQLRAPKQIGLLAPNVQFPCVMELLLEYDIGINAPSPSTSEYWYWMDKVEVPAGSGMFYFVASQYWVALGFGNQYKTLVVLPTWCLDGTEFSTFANWPYAPPWTQPIYAP